MHNFQIFLKNIRKSYNLKLETVADAINLSVETIKLIEDGDDNKLLLHSNIVLKSQIRRYCEYLKIPEINIISILNKIDIIFYKKSRYGKLKLFDYINRILIILLFTIIILFLFKYIKENIFNKDQKILKPYILYTPIHYYDMNDYKKNIK